MNAAEEEAEDAQYNQLVVQFASGDATSQGSIANPTATNASQQQQIAALQSQLQSANSVAQVMYAPPRPTAHDEHDANAATAGAQTG